MISEAMNDGKSKRAGVPADGSAQARHAGKRPAAGAGRAAGRQTVSGLMAAGEPKPGAKTGRKAASGGKVAARPGGKSKVAAQGKQSRGGGRRKPDAQATALRAETRRTRRLGYSLIGVGSVGLLLALLFSGMLFSGMGARFRQWIYGPEKAPSPWDFSDIEPLDELKAVPSARGWSALDSFYATHPNVEGEEEYYLDPALWREVIAAKPNASGGAGTVPAGGTGDSVSVAAGQAPRPDAADSTAAPVPSRRSMGLWTGPADGTLVDTSIRPAQEQLRRQGIMALQAPADSLYGADSMALTREATAQAPAGDKALAAAPVAAGNDGAAQGGANPTGAAAGKPTSEKALHVEFWESPVHYKGYQLSGNNLILYGINDADSLRFENHPDGVWMYHKTAVYRLTASTEMQRFELISGTDSLEEPLDGATEADSSATSSSSATPSPAKPAAAK